MRVRTYGESGRLVVLLHGGPGAPGHMAPVARGLADRFRILEPFQRPSGGEPLTVARHVEDLRDLIVARAAGEKPAVVGSSWGAMLALAFAAAHPDLAGPLVLIGCGTFDPAARARLQRTLEARQDDALRRRLEALAQECPDPDERLRAMGTLVRPSIPTIRPPSNSNSRLATPAPTRRPGTTCCGSSRKAYIPRPSRPSVGRCSCCTGPPTRTRDA
jgi:pimeloyl-ACP methyl ester carboxylesterase